MSPKLIAEIKLCFENPLMGGLHGWCWLDKAMIMADLILQRRIITYVEIGIFGGKSLIPIALAMREQGFGKAYGIDPFTVSAALEGENGQENDRWWSDQNRLDMVFRHFRAGLQNRRLEPYCVPILARSKDAASLFGSRDSIGMLHIDGNHSSLTSLEDAQVYGPRVVSGGILVADDVNWASTGPMQEYLRKDFTLLKEIRSPQGSSDVFIKN